MEHLTVNQWVVGSIPTSGAIFIKPMNIRKLIDSTNKLKKADWLIVHPKFYNLFDKIISSNGELTERECVGLLNQSRR